MNPLSDILEKLQDTAATISRAERSLTHDSPPSELANLRSLRKRQRVLEDRFTVESARAGASVCTYRLAFDQERPVVSGVSRALADFQQFFAVVFDALKHGPKPTGHISTDAALNTTLEWGYVFPGSLGIVMMLPSEQLLFGETNIDLAMKVVLAMMKAERPDQIAGFAQRLGLGPIRAMYQWANDHARAGLSASVEWRHHREIKARVLVQEEEIRHLQQTLDAMGDERTEQVVVTGVLVALDSERGTFRLSVPDAADIRGGFRGIIGLEQPGIVPKRYRATLTKRTRVRYSTEKDEETWVLDRLEEPDVARAADDDRSE